MTQTRTFGRYPTLGEMKWYYSRDDVLKAVFDACQRRTVTAALRGAHWEIHPTSKEHLHQIINETIKTQIEPIFTRDSDCLSELRPRVEVVPDLESPDSLAEAPGKYLALWHGTTMDRVQEILDNGFKTQAGGRGVWFSPLTRINTISVAVAASPEDVLASLRLGFHY